uniref:Laminin EGF-like domain-containing protein n=1 Tax=Panagrolaimus sp. JU765 TaxID=591449 RepID=A0AC34Q8Z5_9BILA
GASECYLASDGAVKCRNCPAGFSGDRCDKCAPGYTLSAKTGGRDCEPVGRVRSDRIDFVDSPKGLPSDPYAAQRLQQQQNARRRHRRRRYRVTSARRFHRL